MRHLTLAALASSFALTLLACASDTDATDDQDTGGGKSDSTRCEDTAYGNGVCDIDLACGIPDIDCFTTFESDAQAKEWLDSFYPLAFVTDEADPRVVRAHQLVDRAWTAMKAAMNLGDLENFKVTTLVVDDPNLNAWVVANPSDMKAGLSVQINAGSLAEGIDQEALYGVVLHELAHIVKLHVLPEVKERTRKYYVAKDEEPIGASQPNNPQLAALVAPWLADNSWSGGQSHDALADMPYGGTLGQVFGYYLSDTVARVPSCMSQLAAVSDNINQVNATWDALAEDVAPPASLKAKIQSDLSAASTCLAQNGPQKMREFLTANDGWLAYVEAAVPMDEHWLLDEEAFDAMTVWAYDRRSKQQALQAKAKAELGVEWSAVRYYSTEEQADDIATQLSMGAAQPGTSAFLLTALGATAAQCEERIAAKTVPYGNLADDHHATCWRVAHARDFAAKLSGSERSRMTFQPAPKNAPWRPTVKPTGKPMY